MVTLLSSVIVRDIQCNKCIQSTIPTILVFISQQMNTTEFAEVTVSVGVNSPLPLELKVVIAVLAGLSLVLLCLLYYCIRSSQSKNQKSVNMPDRERTNMFICSKFKK